MRHWEKKKSLRHDLALGEPALDKKKINEIPSKEEINPKVVEQMPSFPLGSRLR
jgi:hypothetical protein